MFSKDNANKTREFTLLKIYFTLASIIGLIGAVSGIGSLGYNFLISKIITDEEYAMGSSYNYGMKNCDTSYSVSDTKDPSVIKQKERTTEEIAQCKKEEKESLIQKRHYDIKDGMINGSVWGTLFLIVFLVHFPILLKKNEEK
ncbi:MAG: hypothetical protein PHF46_01300 [Candidatus Gracilibacteria bacterium]|nr:hypothetical protein [Candidatus Gracilibacteria bacterium]MDD3120027.1 hypothetical protein [Candidatus Gracilibacteria bacterium]MDD4530840.1 hypothetical protein [Candidatus Gracilibacteria bacterium]